jgi:hypothetical protein
MPARTDFVIETFSHAPEGLRRDQPIRARNRAQAERLAVRLAQWKEVVVAIARKSDPAIGQVGEPEIIAVHGEIPDDLVKAA